MKNLTDKECGIMQCIFSGMSNLQIADHYKISKHTIKSRVSILMGKIGVKNRWSLAVWWWQYAIIGKQEPVYKPDKRASVGIATTETHRARKKNAKGNGVSNPQWQDILEKYGNKCLKCGSENNLSMDHIIPLSLGGDHDISNIQPLCRKCNSKKNAKYEDYR